MIITFLKRLTASLLIVSFSTPTWAHNTPDGNEPNSRLASPGPIPSDSSNAQAFPAEAAQAAQPANADEGRRPGPAAGALQAAERKRERPMPEAGDDEAQEQPATQKQPRTVGSPAAVMSPGKGEASQNQPIPVAEPSRGPAPGRSMIPVKETAVSAAGTNDLQQASTTIKHIPPILTEDIAPLHELLQSSLDDCVVSQVLGWAKQHPLIVEKGTRLSDYLDRVHLIPYGIQKTTLLHYFRYDFGGTDRKQEAALEHRLAQHRVYTGSRLSEVQIGLLNQKAVDISNSDLPGYVSFSSGKMVIDASTPHHIVMTHKEFRDPDNREALRPHFERNPNHTLVIDATKPGLTMTCYNFPDFVKRIAFTDTRSEVEVIEHDFLTCCENLTHFDSSGLTAVKTIGGGFLFGCRSLTHFDSSGLTAVEHIENGFLAECGSLTHFDSSVLTAVEHIGNEFLKSCRSLTHFDSSVLMAVKKIGNEFLANCENLTHFDSSGLTAVKTIGNKFLCGCSRLTHFDSSGLKAVEHIGNGFLTDCESLTHFDSSGLTAVKTIGKGFLTYCKSLTHFNFSDFKALEAIGRGFLASYYLQTRFPRCVKPEGLQWESEWG